MNKFNIIQTEESKQNKVFCPAPFLHTHTWPDGRVFPCCMAEYDGVLGNLQNSSNFIDIWNNENYKQLRKDLINGVSRPDICNRCYEIEKFSNDSLRIRLIRDYWEETENQLDQTDDDYNLDLKLVYWDYRFNNICNMSCRTCGPDLSSGWYDDHIALYGVVPKYAKEKFTVYDTKENSGVYKELVDDQIDIVKQIYFAGGEPILMPEHNDIIQKLISYDRFDVNLIYSSNCSVLTYKSTYFPEEWIKFKKVQFMCSIDDVEARAEYIRNGTNWKKLKENLLVLKTLSEKNKNFEFGYSPTISIFNILTIDKFINYLIHNDLMDEKSLFSYNVLQGPMEFNIQTLSTNLKKQANSALDRLEKILQNFPYHTNGVQKLRKHLNTEVENAGQYRATAVKKISEIDIIRKQTIVEHFPELSEYYNHSLYPQHESPIIIKKV